MNMKRMSLMFAINRELRSINKKIDEKIVKGISYEKVCEATKENAKRLFNIKTYMSYQK